MYRAAIAAGVVLTGAADASDGSSFVRVESSKGKVAGMRKRPSGGEPFARFNGNAVFRDDVQSYATTELATDMTASSPLAFSWQVSAPAALPR